MADQIVLAWTVDVAGSSFGPAQAAAALGAVPLYVDPNTDPVLGAQFGLTVGSDTTSTGATTATRTLTLNMTVAAGVPHAPPPFPCHPRTSTPPVLPYPLRTTKTLPGSFFVSQGATNIPTTETQLPSITTGDTIQFLSQEGVFYTVAAGTTATSINLTTAYTGTSGNTGAFKDLAAPVVLAAVYSSSDLDTNGVATTPALVPGAGAQTISIEYIDSLGAGPFISTVALTGKRPVAIPLQPGSIDIAEIVDMFLATVGGFTNNVGEITLVELSSALPPIPSSATPLDFVRLTDEAQMLIKNALVYLPPSYFALAQQGVSKPQLPGDFMLTTGSVSVPVTADHSGSLFPGDVLQFAEQMTLDTAFGTTDVLYTVATVTPKYITLTTPFTGIDNNFTGTNQEGTNSNHGTKGNLGDKITLKPSGAYFPLQAVPPSNDQLAGPLGQFVALETAAPPLNPPLDPQTVPVPTFLSGFFTRTLQLSLAGVPVVPQPITFI